MSGRYVSPTVAGSVATHQKVDGVAHAPIHCAEPPGNGAGSSCNGRHRLQPSPAVDFIPQESERSRMVEDREWTRQELSELSDCVQQLYDLVRGVVPLRPEQRFQLRAKLNWHRDALMEIGGDLFGQKTDVPPDIRQSVAWNEAVGSGKAAHTIPAREHVTLLEAVVADSAESDATRVPLRDALRQIRRRIWRMPNWDDSLAPKNTPGTRRDNSSHLDSTSETLPGNDDELPEGLVRLTITLNAAEFAGKYERAILLGLLEGPRHIKRLAAKVDGDTDKVNKWNTEFKHLRRLGLVVRDEQKRGFLTEPGRRLAGFLPNPPEVSPD